MYSITQKVESKDGKQSPVLLLKTWMTFECREHCVRMYCLTFQLIYLSNYFETCQAFLMLSVGPINNAVVHVCWTSLVPYLHTIAKGV